MTSLPKAFDIIDMEENQSLADRKIGDIIENLDESSEIYNSHLVPLETLTRRVFVIDIVTKDSTSSNCFTKAYSQYFEGTGSIFTNTSLNYVEKILEECRNCSCKDLSVRLLSSLNLRFFTPTEVSRLMSFPHDRLKFPSSITRKQKYRLLGNSINVLVVSKLISLLLH